MIMLIKDDLSLLNACADLYAESYGEAPWNESFDPDALKAYLRQYVNRPGLHMYVLLRENAPVGIALCCIVPYIGSDFARIEDFCIAPSYQREGLGSRFMALLCDDLRASGCDSMLLATQRNYPSHHFYIKNGFRSLNSSVHLFREL